MRIISQDGKIDVPYEMTAIHLLEGSVLMNMVGDTGKGSVIARYSTSEKAQKAMEMLREQYAHMKRVECMSASLASCEVSTLSNKDAKLLGDEVQKLMCFQFPQDEDVEV